MPNPLAQLPPIHRLLAHPRLEAARTLHGAVGVRAAARHAVAMARQDLAAGLPAPALADLVARALLTLEERTRPAYPPLVNATGVLIHTNLGRAPHLSARAEGYLGLETDIETGERGERLTPVVDRLTRYFGCEAATVVTNNAAALVLLLAARAAGRQVVVSRGELVEIGGAFRLPEIMAAAGTRLVEVGCTNRTRAADYASAITPETAALLVVHRSNFHMLGFVSSPDLGELVSLGRERGVAVWVDQGSGCHLGLGAWGLRHEPTVSEILTGGAEIVLFSGDKLLGGPQAGLLVGRHDGIEPLRSHPLRRALRPDKNALAALAATLDAYLAARPEDVPLYRLLGVGVTELERRARRLTARLRRAGVTVSPVSTRSLVGGGTTPDQTLPSWGLRLPGGHDLARRLRGQRIPVIGRLEEDCVILDLRAVFAEQDAQVQAAVVSAVAGES
ncbi:MAG TPA: L-seryl-tRNA(Sec) selenium transferase [Thermoanaerobaculaceae bacterium]|nr:L-seryl-tRNA(Sec) selenium transferase [Thermoanaerobaculaceae bacterium]